MLSALVIVVSLAAGAVAVPVQADAAQPAIEDWTARLRARQPVAGIGGFESVSLVRYAAAPDEEHQLTCTYVFPARARWQITVRGKPESGRHIEYRCGDAYFELAQSSEHSLQVGASASEAQQRLDKCELFELRRAAFLWPDGFEWKGEGDFRSAVTECGRALVALLGSDGRPVSIAFDAAPSRGNEALRIGAWRERQGRWWPETLEFWQGAALVWAERVESLASRLTLLDSYFVPPDRRAPTSAGRAARVLHLDAPEQHEFRSQLDPKGSWGGAAREWTELQQRVARALPSGWSCLPGAAFELDEHGTPTVAIVRLRGLGEPPKGSSTASAEQGLTTSEPWPAPELTEALDRLRKSSPGDAKFGRVLLLFSGPVEVATSVQVVATLRGSG